MNETKYKEYRDLPMMLTVSEMGKALGISRATAYELVRFRGFPSLKIGTRILVPKDKLIKWIDEQTEENE